MPERLDAFLAMLERGQDSALLRFSIGSEYLAADRAADAVAHLEAAVRLDRDYSAAWKLLGKALVDCGEIDRAVAAFSDGIAVAEAQGDRQAVKEMSVFRKRAEKSRGSGQG